MPAVFQCTMDTILQGLPNVICYLDDILVNGEFDERHLDNLRQVLGCLKEHGVGLKREISVSQDSVEYSGLVLSRKGCTIP